MLNTISNKRKSETMEETLTKKSKSSIIDTNSFSTVTEGKYSKIKSVTKYIEEYLETWCESTAITINRHLQTLSYALDVSIFDPHKNITIQFFVSLYDLMNKLEPRNQMAWYCVDVLANICKNTAARNELIHTYNFLPSLSRLVGNQLSTEKKVKILRLLQDLTCGIKINWQIPHLAHLMSTLVRWVETQSEEIVTLSLGVLVNLCYKNIPAIYTLSRNVDIKEFLKNCVPLQGPAILEVYLIKLMLIVENTCGGEVKQILQNLIKPSFKSILEAYQTRNATIMRHVVEFYTDMLTGTTQENPLYSYDKYNECINELLEVLESNESDLTSAQHSECVSIILHFLNCLMEAKVPNIAFFYERIMNFALKWTQSETVSSEALSVLKTIAISNVEKNVNILDGLVVGLPAFLVALTVRNELNCSSVEKSKRLGGLLQLLRVMLQVETIRQTVLDEIKEEMLTGIFMTLLGDNEDRIENEENDANSVDAISLYIYAVSLVVELAKYDPKWAPLQNNIMGNKRIHLLLAQALFYDTPEDIKTLTLDVISNPRFSRKNISAGLISFQSIFSCKPSAKLPPFAALNSGHPLLSVAQINSLNGTLDRLKTALNNGDPSSVTTSDVLEVYEYKLATMGQAEKAALASVEAANDRCARLQHRVAQQAAEQGRVHQLLLNAQQKQEEATKKLCGLKGEFREMSNKLEAEKGRFKACDSQLKLREKKIADLQKQLEEMTKERDNLQGQCEKLKQLKVVISKLEESSKKLEKNLEKKEDLLRKSNASNENLKSQVSQLETEIKQKNAELKDIQTMLQQKSQILESIMKMANSSQ